MDMDEFLDRELRSSTMQKAASQEVYQPQSYAAQGSESDYDALWRELQSTTLGWDASWQARMEGSQEALSKDLAAQWVRAAKVETQFRESVQKARLSIARKDAALSQAAYDDASRAFASLPQSNYAAKRRLEEELMRMQADIHALQTQDTQQRTMQLISDINAKITALHQMVDSGMIRQSIEPYLKCLMQFTAIPAGFLNEKLRLGRALFDLYKTIAIQQEIERLRNQLPRKEGFGIFQTAQPHHVRRPIPATPMHAQGQHMAMGVRR